MGIISKLSLLALTVEARRHLDDPDIAIMRKDVDSVDGALGAAKSPLVKMSECEEMCIFRQQMYNDVSYNEWCFKTYSDVMSIGYNIENSNDETKWVWMFKPYLTAAFQFGSYMNIARLFKHNWGFELAEFTTDVFYSGLFSNRGQVCIGIGWNLGNINFKIDTDFTVKECSKTIFNDFSDMKSTWTGDNAQWLEMCEDSASSNAAVMDRSYVGPVDQMVWGGKEEDGPGCFQFADWSKWAPYAAQMAYYSAEIMAENY